MIFLGLLLIFIHFVIVKLFASFSPHSGEDRTAVNGAKNRIIVSLVEGRETMIIIMEFT